MWIETVGTLSRVRRVVCSTSFEDETTSLIDAEACTNRKRRRSLPGDDLRVRSLSCTCNQTGPAPEKQRAALAAHRPTSPSRTRPFLFFSPLPHLLGIHWVLHSLSHYLPFSLSPESLLHSRPGLCACHIHYSFFHRDKYSLRAALRKVS